MPGLLDTDEDLAKWLAKQHAPPDPITGGFTHSFSPSMQARINAEVQPGYQDARAGYVPGQVTPTGTLNLGPLSLTGGLNLQQLTDPESGKGYVKAAPMIGAGLNVPLPGDTKAEAGFKYTPEQMLALEGAYRRKLLGGDLDVTLRHQRPYGGTPDTYVGARYSRRF